MPTADLRTAKFKQAFNPAYHGLMRPEIANLIPQTAKNIIDFGCGSGALGEFIKKRQPCHYTGIEANQKAADIAKTRLDTVHSYDIEDISSMPLDRQFDTAIFADILEHLVDPWTVLSSTTKSLTEQATIISSIPNIAHPSVQHELSLELFRYAPAGILDITHLRHFTLPTICQLFASANLKITSITYSPSIDNPVQMLITAKKPLSTQPPPTCTIIIPTYEQLDLLKITINSIRSHTSTPVKIILITNGSGNELLNWVQEQPDIFEIRCSKNLGFTIACNLGLAIVDTPYALIANNDISVTKGWLEHMIACATSSPGAGIIGPRSNYVSGPQLDKEANYKTEDELTTYAAKIADLNQGLKTPFRRIVFFCALIKKEVIDTIGLLDEAFSPGNFEDDDYCLRAQLAGFTNFIDHSTFIHHYGSRSWLQDSNTFKKILEKNKAYFLEKWGNKASIDLSAGS